MSNPFEEADAWVPTMALPPGQHRVFIKSVLADKTKRGGEMVTLELGNDEGNIRDWITLQRPDPHVKGSSIGIQQIAALFDAAMVYRPKEGEFDSSTMAVSQTALNRLAGREVGIVVRMETGTDQDGRPKEYARVKGYIQARELVAGKTYGATQPVPDLGRSGPAADDDDIPF